MEEKTVLCAASSYEQKYYLNPDFAALPEAVQQELQIMATDLRLYRLYLHIKTHLHLEVQQTAILIRKML